MKFGISHHRLPDIGVIVEIIF